DVEGFRAGQPERDRALAIAEAQRQYAHADEIGTVDALETFRDHSFDAEQAGAFGGPVARGAGAVFLACDHHQRHTIGPVLHRGIVDRHFPGRIRAEVQRVAALLTPEHQVLDADVGEGAAYHHVVVATARAV